MLYMMITWEHVDSTLKKISIRNGPKRAMFIFAFIQSGMITAIRKYLSPPLRIIKTIKRQYLTL